MPEAHLTPLRSRGGPPFGLEGLLQSDSAGAAFAALGYASIPHMRRTTVKLPDELDARLRHEAERRHMTISELTREAIETHLGGPHRRLGAAGAGRSGRSDISERIEEILRDEVRASRY